MRGSQLTGDSIVGVPVGRQQADPGMPDNPLGRRPSPDPRFQGLSLVISHRQPVGRVPHEPYNTRADSYSKDIIDVLH